MTALLVANNGGHITQLHRLRDRLALGRDVVFVTVPTPQTQSLLSGEEVHWAKPSPTRDVGSVMFNSLTAHRVFKDRQFDLAVSTGAALALAYLPQARLRGIPSYYIESATRSNGPSTSGRILARMPGVTCLTQHEGWAGGRWQFLESPWSSYAPVRVPTKKSLRRVVVVLGTQDRFPFERLIERLVEILPAGCDVLWQTGPYDVSRFGIVGRSTVPATELEAAIETADVVVAHAGTGIALTALAAGKIPVLAPRRPELGEHVDGHQSQIAECLANQQLAIVREADEITLADLLEAASCAAMPISLPTLRLPA